MIRIALNWGTYGAWTAGIGKTALDLVEQGNIQFSSLSFLLAISGLAYGIVRVVNAILNGRVDREGKRLDNLLKEQELYYDMVKEIEDEKRK